MIQLTYNETDNTLSFVKDDGSIVKKYLNQDPDAFEKILLQYLAELDNQGIPGPKGDKGDDGYTPIRGTDYWTDSDKTEIVNEVLSHFTDMTQEAF